MASRAEGAHELTDFTLLCISCSAICSSDDRVESVKNVLDEQKCALFTCLAIRQQSQRFHTPPVSQCHLSLTQESPLSYTNISKDPNFSNFLMFVIK